MNRRAFCVTPVVSLFLSANSHSIRASQAWGTINVMRNPGCGCCEKWAVGLKAAGFSVNLSDSADLNSYRTSLGMPNDLAGCHTAVIDRYVIEGHVPAPDIVRLLLEGPDALGLAVPGMPVGSPGMEQDGQAEAFTVFLCNRDGSRSVFSTY